MTEATLWKWFSLFIRLRNADDHGYVKCFTCPKIVFYKQGDCGHGIGRQHKGTKYNEKNNQFQCTDCNYFNEGRKDRFKENVNKLYGPGTWEMIELASRKAKKLSTFEMKVLSKFYMHKVQVLKKEKGL